MAEERRAVSARFRSSIRVALRAALGGVLAFTALGAGALIGLVNGVFVARVGINALITTLASMQVVRGLAFIVSGGSAVGIAAEPFFALGNVLRGMAMREWPQAALGALIASTAALVWRIEAEKVPLTPAERHRVVAAVTDDVLGFGPTLVSLVTLLLSIKRPGVGKNSTHN